MIATEIFRRNHRTIRKALVSLDRALLMETPNWAIVAKNLANYLEIELREYWGSEERWIFAPLAQTGPDAAGVVAQMEQEHRDHGRNLERTRELTKSLTPPEEACTSWRALYLRLGQLEADLMQHIHLENNVLFPRALRES